MGDGVKRIIISYEGVSESEAVLYVHRVIYEGRISESSGIKHYCWHTEFKDGTSVSVRRKHREGAADSFIVKANEPAPETVA